MPVHFSVSLDASLDKVFGGEEVTPPSPRGNLVLRARTALVYTVCRRGGMSPAAPPKP